MKNAHERFGWLEFTRALKDTTVRVRLRLDRCIAELAKNGRDGKFHLLSAVGGESDVSADWAAVQQNQVFKVEGPDFAPVELSLGEKAECYRGSLNLPGRRRAIRHLVAVSAEMAQTRLGGGMESNRTILSDDDPVFVFYRVSERFGLPVVPEWALWFMGELKRRRAITALTGLGCSPVLVVGTKERFLSWISRGLRRGLIQFPAGNGPIRWPPTAGFLKRSSEPPADTVTTFN
ncbi:MAG: hypothetical protein ACRD2O_04080 [Terriglobia bacterium]